AGALLLAAVWFVIQIFLLPDAPRFIRLGVAGGLLGLATVLGAVLAFILAPPKIAAALLLDERFGLKERVTTSLTLAPELAASSAAQALLADVNQRVGGLDIGSRF